jgi:metal-responsive CopG/Arc/MetJ family transcriptional regulator
MVRISVYLTEAQDKELTSLARATGKSRSELVREAVDHVIEKYSPQRRKAILERAAGMWKDRDDLPDFEAMRAEWDRRLDPQQ